jgi:hypothetical protein
MRITVIRILVGVTDFGNSLVVLLLVAGGHGQLVDVVVGRVEVVRAWVGEASKFNNLGSMF